MKDINWESLIVARASLQNTSARQVFGSKSSIKLTNYFTAERDGTSVRFVIKDPLKGVV